MTVNNDGCWWQHWKMITDLDSFWADVKHADCARDEVADGFEVQAADAPGAVHQQNDVCLRICFTARVCRDAGGSIRQHSAENIK